MGNVFNRDRIYISSIQKRMFFLAFATSFVAVFTQTLAVLIDNVIVCAFYGEAEIASVILAGPFFYLLEIPAAGLAAGIQVVCAKELGAGRVDRVNRLFNQIFLLSAAVLTILTVLSFLSAPQLAVLFGARGNTAGLQPYASEYLYGLSFEILPYVLFCIMTPVVILDNGGKLVSIASVCGCITDIVLDLLSVRFGWGLFGIGIASSASAAVYLLLAMLHFLKRDRVLRLEFVPIRLGELREIFVSAAPKAFLCLSDALRAALFIFLVSVTGGVVGTCVLSIHETISYAVTIFASAITGAVGILAGICYGEKNGEELEGCGVLAHRCCLAVSATVIAVLAVVVRPLSAALMESRASADLLFFAICCVMVRLPFSTLVYARIGYLQAVGQIRAAQRMGIASNLAFPVIAACLLSVPFGVRGVFLAFPVSQVMTLFVSWLIHVRRTGTALPPGADYLEADGSFFPRPGDVISYPIQTMGDCSLAGEQVSLFCRGHHLEERTAFLAGLCTEELTANVVEHGLRPTQARRAADLRVVIDGHNVIIRVRDGGPAFNLKQFADRLAKEDNAQAAPGLRLLLHGAKDISYYRTYGMNITIMKL